MLTIAKHTVTTLLVFCFWFTIQKSGLAELFGVLSVKLLCETTEGLVSERLH